MSSPSFTIKNEIVRAGAGAGKTQTLTNRVLQVAKEFYEKEGRSPKIIVTTFTKKATEELRERLLKSSCEREDSRLIDFVTSKGQLHISTIHGVVSLFLRRFGHWLDIDSGFTVMEPATAERMASKILRDLLVENQEFTDLLDDYTIAQLSSILRDYCERKTEFGQLSPYTIEELRQENQNIISSLASEMQFVADCILAESTNDKWVAYAQQVLHLSDSLVSSVAERKPLDWIARWDELEKPRYMSKNPPFSDQVNIRLTALLTELKKWREEIDVFIHEEVFIERAHLFSTLADSFAEIFKQKKMSLGLFEMSDLEAVATETIRSHPEMAQAFSADWDYWLIDEFQDTSPAQVELLRHLIGSKPYFVVGDPQQSIYLFRGARSEVFEFEESHVAAGGGVHSVLLKNYRSRPELLLFFNDFFASLKGAGTNRFVSMEPKTSEVDSTQQVATFCLVPKEEENLFAPIAQHILAGVKNGNRFEDYCLLARTNRELNEIAQYLEKFNLPTHIHASDGFFQRREILDVLSIMKFTLNQHDNLNLMRILRSPWFKISDHILVDVLKDRPVHYWVHLQKKLSSNEVILRLQQLLVQASEIGVYQAVKAAVLSSGLIDLSHFHDVTGRRESNIWKLFHLLREKEKAPGFSYMTFVQNALRSERSAEGEEESDAVAALEPNRVNLMTIHKSKGLKFKHVILPNLHKKIRTSKTRAHSEHIVFDEELKKFALGTRLGEERKFSHNGLAKKILEKLSVRELAEQERVLYVALTRAQESVFLHMRSDFGTGSWGAQIGLSLEAGLHSRAQYSYAVVHDWVTPQPFQASAASSSSVRELWVKPATLPVKPRISVTRLLEQQDPSNMSSQASSAEGARTKNLKREIELPVLGQKLHSMLEQMKYSHESDFADYGRKWFAERSTEFYEGLQYVLDLKAPPIRQVIEVGEVEWGFQLQTARGILEGQIDLWGTVADASGGPAVTWLVDYKSGTSKYSEKAFDQLNLYSFALRRHGVRGPIQLAVIYALEHKTKIQEALSEAEIQSRYGL